MSEASALQLGLAGINASIGLGATFLLARRAVANTRALYLLKMVDAHLAAENPVLAVNCVRDELARSRSASTVTAVRDLFSLDNLQLTVAVREGRLPAPQLQTVSGVLATIWVPVAYACASVGISSPIFSTWWAVCLAAVWWTVCGIILPLCGQVTLMAGAEALGVWQSIVLRYMAQHNVELEYPSPAGRPVDGG